MPIQRYVINGWATDGDNFFFCDDCGYPEESGRHAKDCRRYSPVMEAQKDQEEKVRETTWNLCKKYDSNVAAANRKRTKVLLRNYITIEIQNQFGVELENLFREEWAEEVNEFCEKYNYS